MARRDPRLREDAFARGLNSRRDFTLLLLARLAMSTSRAMAGVVVPLYLVALGFSGIELGFIFLVAGAAAALMATLVGFAAARIPARIFMISIPMLASFAALVYAFSQDRAALFAFAAIGTFGRGAGAGAGNVGPQQPAESQLIARVVHSQRRNQAFGIISAASSAGAVVGAGLSAVLALSPSSRLAVIAAFRPGMLAIAIFSALAAMAAVLLTKGRPANPDHRSRQRLFAFPINSRRLVYRLWATNTLNGIAVGMFGPFVTYWLHIRFRAGQATIGELYLLINVGTVAAGLVAPQVARVHGTVRATSALRILQGLLLIPLALAPSIIWAGAIYFIRMFAQRTALPLRQSYVMAMADPNEQARVAALSNLPSQVMSAVSPTLSGYLFEESLLSAPLLIGGLLQAASAVLFFAFFHRDAPPEEIPSG